MADALRVDVGEGTEELVGVQLDLEQGHGSLELVKVPRGAVDGLWDIFEHQVEVDFVLLEKSRHVNEGFVEQHTFNNSHSPNYHKLHQNVV